jgi:hypothetical protein
MSSSQTGPTSTTGSLDSSASSARPAAGPPGRPGLNVVTCGALAGHLRDIAARRGWPVTVHALPARLHNRPGRIPGEVRRAIAELPPDPGSRTVVAYADCGTYGQLDQACEQAGVSRLPGLHCYDFLAGPDTVRELFHMEPGTYLLTDYLVRTFDRTVVASLGLDRHPELWPDYFAHYTRVAWLAQEPTPELEAEAARIAARFGLPLTTITTGLSRLEAALSALIEGEA